MQPTSFASPMLRAHATRRSGPSEQRPASTLCCVWARSTNQPPLLRLHRGRRMIRHQWVRHQWLDQCLRHLLRHRRLTPYTRARAQRDHEYGRKHRCEDVACMVVCCSFGAAVLLLIQDGCMRTIVGVRCSPSFAPSPPSDPSPPVAAALFQRHELGPVLA
jgi:hypothetical protein